MAEDEDSDDRSDHYTATSGNSAENSDSDSDSERPFPLLRRTTSRYIAALPFAATLLRPSGNPEWNAGNVMSQIWLCDTIQLFQARHRGPLIFRSVGTMQSNGACGQRGKGRVSEEVLTASTRG